MTTRLAEQEQLEAKKKQCWKMLEDGASEEVISNTLGMSRVTIAEWARLRPKSVAEKMAELRRKDPGLTGAQLAERLGVSRSTIRYAERHAKTAMTPAPAHEGIYEGSVAIFRERKRRAKEAKRRAT